MSSIEVTEATVRRDETNEIPGSSTKAAPTRSSDEGAKSTDTLSKFNNVDTILFGSRNTVVSDEFCDCIDQALVEGVASLPLMDSAEEDGTDETRSEKMLKKLRKAYLRNVDLAEIYAGRNIFSISNRTPFFRQRVVAGFLNKINEEVLTHETDIQASDIPAMPETNYAFPSSKDEVPSTEMLAELEEQLKVLRSKLKETRSYKMERLRYCKDLEQAERFSEDAVKPLDNKSLQIVDKSIQKMVKGKDEMEILQIQGKQLIEKMDEDKRQRLNNENENELPVITRKKKKLTLEEDYQERRNVLAPTQDNDFARVRQLLQRKS